MRADMGIVVLSVLSAYLVAITYMIETDSKTLLRGCYVLSVGVIVLTASSSWFRREVAPVYKRDWGALFLCLFCAYLLFQALMYPDWNVAENYLKIWVLQVFNGTGLGFLSLSFFLRSRDDASSQSVTLRVYRLVIAIGIAILAYVSWRLFLRMSDGFFSIRSNTPSVYYYQIFGNYAIVLYGAIAMLLRRALSARTAIRELIYRNAALSVFTLWLFLLAQLVGSNNAAATIVAIGALTLIGDTIRYFCITAGRERWLGSLFLSGEGVVTLIVAVVIVANLPPIRLFGYKPVPYLSMLQYSGSAEKPVLADTSSGDEGILEGGGSVEIASSSISSRGEILANYGVAQLSVNPIFGDLGAEIVTGTPGSYLHSLLSIQTHLGLVGSVLMLGFLTSRIRRLVTDAHDTVVIAFIIVTFTVAALATFFSWLPFWFTLGLLLAMPSHTQYGFDPGFGRKLGSKCAE